jgi:hypothetical protein
MDGFIGLIVLVLIIVVPQFITWLFSMKIGIFILFLLAGIIPSFIYIALTHRTWKTRLFVLFEIIIYTSFIYNWVYSNGSFDFYHYGNLWYLFISFIVYFFGVLIISLGDEDSFVEGQSDPWYFKYSFLSSMIAAGFLPIFIGIGNYRNYFIKDLDLEAIWFLTVIPVAGGLLYLLLRFLLKMFFKVAAGFFIITGKSIGRFFSSIKMLFSNSTSDEIKNGKEKLRLEPKPSAKIVLNKYSKSFSLLHQGIISIFITAIVVLILFFYNPLPYIVNRIIFPSNEWLWFQDNIKIIKPGR